MITFQKANLLQGFAFMAVIALSACGGGGGSTIETVPFSVRTVASNLSNPQQTSPTTVTLTSQVGAVEVVLTRAPSYDIPGFEAFVETDGPNSAMILRRNPFETSFSTYVSSDISRGTGPEYDSRVAYGDSGTLPIEGSATYTGVYAGFLETLTDNHVNSYISGQVLLTADFAGGTLAGVITDRQRYLTATGGDAAYDFDDLVLEETPIDGQNSSWTFNGGTNGGALDTAAAIPRDGDLSGNWTYRFAGDKAEGVSGLVTLNHQYIQPTIADDYLEIGVFMADRDGPVRP